MKRSIKLPTEYPWGNKTNFRNKMKKGLIHWIVSGTVWKMYDLACIKFGRITFSERRVHNVVPITIYYDQLRKTYITLVNHHAISGMELYRLVLGCGMTTGKWAKMVEHWTNNGKELFIGQLVVWENMEPAHPYTPYKLQANSRRVSPEIIAASKLLYKLDQTKKGKDLLSPVLGYQFLMECEHREVELNFQQFDSEKIVGVFPMYDDTKTGLTINEIQKPHFFPSKKRGWDEILKNLKTHRFVKS